MCQHTYHPTTIISEKGSMLVSQILLEVATVLGVKLRHATTKHAQRTGILERTHASVRPTLKMERGEFRTQWHKYLPLAGLNHNTTYHASLGCEPSRYSIVVYRTTFLIKNLVTTPTRR